MSTTPTFTKKNVGAEAERRALKFLTEQGLKLIEQNYFYKHLGEIDLIMWDKELIVFIEVRYRNTQRYGCGLESVTRGKQRKIIRTALQYLQKYNLLPYPMNIRPPKSNGLKMRFSRA